VCDGNAFETTGVSTFGDESGAAFSSFATTVCVDGAGGVFGFVVSGAGAVAGAFCVTISLGCLAALLDATTAAIGLGSIEGVDSTFAISVDAVAGTVD
jgi:hypothetical protein